MTAYHQRRAVGSTAERFFLHDGTPEAVRGSGLAASEQEAATRVLVSFLP